MNAKTYQEQRGNLLTLLQQAVNLLPAADAQGQKLQQLQKKLLEDQFTIALVAGFQCGKSTTFDAICDGRELSPPGFGSKTSGCLVYAQNIADAKEGERAVVRWRTEPELMASLDCSGLPDLREKLSTVDLNNFQDLQKLSAAASEEYRRWSENKAQFDVHQEGLLDVVRCALLIARFHHHPKLCELRQRQEWKPEELGRYVRFPKDWEKRWVEKGVAGFEIEEVAFLFVAHVRFHLHCETLGRTGCVVLDCPGLFASKWDTSVAMEAMQTADAILFLIDGERSIPQSGLAVLKTIHNCGMEHKLFYAVNLRKEIGQTRENIISPSVAVIEREGMRVAEKDVSCFHAALALRSIQGVASLEGRLDEATKASILKEYPKDTVDGRILKDIRMYTAALGIDTPAWKRDEIAASVLTSGLTELSERMENFVIKHKAEFILLRNGGDRVVGVLKQVEGELKNRELAATRNKAEQEEEFRKAHERLEQFRVDCNEQLAGLHETTPDTRLAEDFWGKMNGGMQKVIDESSSRINDEIIKPYFKTLWRNGDQLRNHVKGIIADALGKMLQQHLIAWLEQISLGNNVVYNLVMRDRVLQVQKRIQQKWNNARAFKELELLSQIELREFTGYFRDDLQAAAKSLDGYLAFDVKTIVVSEFFALLLAAITQAFYGLLSFIFGPQATSTRGYDEVRRKVTDAISLDPFRSALQTKVQETIAFNVQKMRVAYVDAFGAAVREPYETLAGHMASQRKLLDKAQEELVAIAEEAEAFRCENVEPLRREVEAFAEGCRNELGKKSE